MFAITLKLILILQRLLLVTAETIPCDSPLYLPFQCADGKTCIDRMEGFCNGMAECPDQSDEYLYNRVNETNLGIECKSRYIDVGNVSCHLPKKYLCDHELDCVGGVDECDCRHTFHCTDGSCSLKVLFCDGKEQCMDGSDEAEYNRTSMTGFQCPVTQFHETKFCVLPDEYVCDGDSDCDNGIDECFCDFSSGVGVYLNNTFSNDKCFRCLDRSLIIPNKFVCDGKINCPDLSDECLCTNRKNFERPEICYHVCDGTDCSCEGELMCTLKNASDSSKKECLPLSAICDMTYDCKDGMDEDVCPENTELFTCHDNSKKIRKNLLCNGGVDCDDGSDEDQCKEITNYICSTYRSYFPHVTDWENKTQTNDPSVGVGSVLQFGYPFYSVRCDGIPECAELDDECYATGCDGARPGYCQFVQKLGNPFQCNNTNSSIIGNEICDGKPTCNDTNPELSVDELYCPNRTYCNNRGASRLPIHLPLSSKCNGIQECDDLSDEIGCPNETHYYCNDSGKTIFIRRSEVCDNTMDCTEGGDECQNCNPNPFSDDEKLIKSRVLVVFLWVIGLFAVIGNLTVFGHQLKNSIAPTKPVGKVSSANRFLVLNLSAANLIVGIYLIALAIKDATVQEYCKHDFEWRSSTTCLALGTILLIGTEASVFIILIMAGHRLFLAVWPFKNHETKAIKISVAIAWLVAFLLALLPHATSLSDYFVSCVWFRRSNFLRFVCRPELETFCDELSKRMETSGMFRILQQGKNWNNMFIAVKEINPVSVPERYFGYYSSHSVCLPRFFPNPKEDNSWGYSLFLVILDFVALVLVMLSYILIYRYTTKTPNASKHSTKKRAANLQKKIARIIVTDFCCWMPICIMAFVQVSGVDIPDNAYAATAIILLPINSALNPCLYSNAFDVIWEKITQLSTKCVATSRETPRDQEMKTSGETSCDPDEVEEHTYEELRMD